MFEYFPILFYKDIFSANFKKICYTFAGTENFGKSETAAKMADCCPKTVAIASVLRGAWISEISSLLTSTRILSVLTLSYLASLISALVSTISSLDSPTRFCM